MSSVSVLSLNIWRFYDWESRKDAILELIRTADADIILLQEAQYDGRYSTVNQAELLASLAGYPFAFFSSTGVKHEQQGQKLDTPVQIGQGVISRLPLHGLESICLTRQPEDKHPRVLQHFSVEKEGKRYAFSNVHFSNHDAWAELHLTETLGMYERRGEQRILIGDFNIKDLSQYKAIYEARYVSSRDQYAYVSYPSKSETLDYALVDRAYELLDFAVLPGECSDHAPLYLHIR